MLVLFFQLWDTRSLTLIKTYITGRPVNAVTMSPLLDHVGFLKFLSDVHFAFELFQFGLINVRNIPKGISGIGLILSLFILFEERKDPEELIF